MCIASRDLYKTSAKAGTTPVDMPHTVKVSSVVLDTRVYQEGALDETVRALLLFFGAHCYSPAFPELIVPAVMQLKLFSKATQLKLSSKATQVARFRRQIKDLTERLERNAAFIARARATAGLTPQTDGPASALAPSGGAAKTSQAPLHNAWEQSAVMVGGDLKDLLEGRNIKVTPGAPKEAGDDSDETGSDEEEDDEEEEGEEGGEAEPRWKEARREKRQRSRADKKGRRGEEDSDEDDEEEEDDEEDAIERRKKKAKAKAPVKKVRAGAVGDVMAGEDEVEALEFSSDED
ncbi:Noc2p family-domain-containing protein [Baffinella frigidus]|nr:Noc2p family-domain-containing protein [Cryptophyta sp. CCMP2293]